MVTLYNNPALREEPMNQKPYIIAPRANESLINWIEDSGRFKPYELAEVPFDDVTAELEEIIGASVYDDKEEEEDWNGED